MAMGEKETRKRVLTYEDQRFCKEAILWKHVSCPYVLKYTGAFYHKDVPAVVTPWMPRGNITEYLERCPDTDRLRLVSSIERLPAPSMSLLRSLLALMCGQREIRRASCRERV